MARKTPQQPLITDVWHTSVAKIEESPRHREPMPDSHWQTLCRSLQSQVSLLPQRQVGELIERIHQGIEWLDEPRTAWCLATCPSCSDPCCTGRRIFFNQADLLCLVAAGRAPLVPGQTRTRASDNCRYLSRNGCRLDRQHRPYVCVWFLCEPQMDLFNTHSGSFQRRFINVLRNVRICRLQLETLYQAQFSNT
jgi:hypothetical protein